MKNVIIVGYTWNSGENESVKGSKVLLNVLMLVDKRTSNALLLTMCRRELVDVVETSLRPKAAFEKNQSNAKSFLKSNLSRFLKFRLPYIW